MSLSWRETNSEVAAADGNNPKHVFTDGVDGNAPRSSLPNNKKSHVNGKTKTEFPHHSFLFCRGAVTDEKRATYCLS